MRHTRPPSIAVSILKRGITFALSCTVLTAMAIPALGPHGQGISVPGGEDQGPAMLLPLDLPAPRLTLLSQELPPARDQAIPQNWLSYRVQSGDTLTSLLPRMGIDSQVLKQLLALDGAREVLDRLHPGQEIKLRLDQTRRAGEAGRLRELVLLDGELTGNRFFRVGEAFRLSPYQPLLDTYTGYRAGVVRHSFYRSAKRAGLSEAMIGQLEAVFGWDIDLGDAQPGDRFTVAFEEHYRQGERVGEGTLLAARLTHRGETFEVVAHRDNLGKIDYFRPDGSSLRQAFLKAPVGIHEVSSPFSPRRRHPVLGTTRAHEGVDYAAPIGTPIRATGDGEVTFLGRQSGYGNVVTLGHAGGYATLYAHMSRFAEGLNPGDRVKQGQVIGYVGRSGLASGPHLHYEFHVADRPVDPLTVDIPGTLALNPAEKVVLAAQTRQLLPALARFERLWANLEEDGLLAGLLVEQTDRAGG